MQAAAKVLIYAEEYCPYCVKVKEIFTGLSVPFVWKVRSQHEAEFQTLSKQYNHKTIPLVLINNQFIGGCSDVQNLQAQGKLNDLLK